MSKAADILADIDAAVGSITGPNLDLSVIPRFYCETTEDTVVFEDGVPQIWIYADTPRITEQSTTVTEIDLEVKITFWYRHVDAQTVGTLANSQLDQDYMTALRQIVYEIENRQTTGDATTDCWLSSDAPVELSRPQSPQTTGDKSSVFSSNIVFTLSFEEER